MRTAIAVLLSWWIGTCNKRCALEQYQHAWVKKVHCVGNNEIELLIKLVLRAHKNSLLFKTRAMACMSAIITSVLVTWHEENIIVFNYLTEVQRNLLAVKASPERWLPRNYKGIDLPVV